MRYIFLLTILLLGLQSHAQQVPQMFNYQAVARNAQGNPIANQVVSVRLTILDNTATGNPVYKEEHSPVTNSLGLFTFQIGTGTVLQGSFSAINWANNAKFLRTEIDMTGGNNYVIMGVTQFVSVPYAVVAQDVVNDKDSQTLLYDNATGNLSISSGNSISLPNLVDTDDQNLNITNNVLNIDNGTGVNLLPYLDNTDNQSLSINGSVMSISGGNSITLPAEIDGSLTNEIQTISLANNNLSLSLGGGSINLSSYLDNTDNQDLTLSNHILSLTNDATTVNLASYLDNTDNQTLSYTNSTGVLSILGGNSVTIPMGGGVSYLAGAGLSLVGNTFTNIGDLSNTNEIQTLSLAGSVLSLSNGGGNVTLPSGSGTNYSSGTGINITGSTISNTAPDQILTLTGSGIATVTGTYPNFNVAVSPQTLAITGNSLSILNGNTVTLPNINYVAGTGITINGNTISNIGDISATNEIQTLSLSGNNVSLSNGGGTITLPSSNSIVIISSSNYTTVTVNHNDIIKIDGTINLSGNYTRLDYNGLTIHGGTFIGTGTEIIEVGNNNVTFIGTQFQNVKIAGLGTSFLNCTFTGNIGIDQSDARFMQSRFYSATVTSTYGNADISLVNCELEYSTISPRVFLCSGSNIYGCTFSDVRNEFVNNQVDGTSITFGYKGSIISNYMANCQIILNNNLFGMVIISNNVMDDPMSGQSDLISVNVDGTSFRYFKITNNIFSCNNASGGGTTNSSIKIAGAFTGSYCTLEVSNNHFDRGNVGIDNSASGSYKFIVKDNIHKNLGAGIGVVNNGSSLYVSDNIGL